MATYNYEQEMARLSTPEGARALLEVRAKVANAFRNSLTFSLGDSSGRDLVDGLKTSEMMLVYACLDYMVLMGELEEVFIIGVKTPSDRLYSRPKRYTGERIRHS